MLLQFVKYAFYAEYLFTYGCGWLCNSVMEYLKVFL